MTLEAMLENKVKAAIARRDFLSFIEYTYPDYQTNWHHALVASEIDKLVTGETKRLAIMEPPRHGKSEQVSRRLPAYVLGRCPGTEMIACSYGADLARRMNRDVQRVIDSPQYAEVFPNARLNRSSARSKGESGFLRNADMFEIVGGKGSYRCAGVGGGITGMGFDFGIIDDPIKDAAQAMSKTYRDKIWEWYTSTFITRASKDARILITMTRWHEDDLLARALAEEDFKIVRLPAIYDPSIADLHPSDKRHEGEALWPERFNIERLTQQKRLMGSYQFNALYQQTPSPSSGELFKRSWFKHYDVLPDSLDEVWESWDLTFKDKETGDYVTGQVWGRVGSSYYLVHQVRRRMGFVDQLKEIESVSVRYPQAVRKLIEDAANGAAVIDVLKRRITGIVPVKPRGDKVTRANAILPLYEAGNVYHPSRSIAPWVDDFETELTEFPNGAHDDQVDATTQALKQGIKRTRTWEIA